MMTDPVGTEGAAQAGGREAEIETVYEALVAIWPDLMASKTKAGLVWGQLVAEVAVDALRSSGSAAADEKGRRARLLSMLLDADAESADLLVDDIEALYGGGTQ
jgi:hypothetical protein